VPRTPTLTYDRGTLILHPPPKGQAWVRFATWDDRVEKFRMPAHLYRSFIEAMRAEGLEITDKAGSFEPTELSLAAKHEPYAHQVEAKAAWVNSGRRGVIVLPTAAGKTYLAQLCMEATPRSTLIVVPTLDLLHQWYADLKAAFPDVEVGLLGGGSKDRTPILVSTYDSAAIYAEDLGNRYGLLIFDECHHLPGEFTRSIAESSIAPYRLGLTATLERSDGKHEDILNLIGPLLYSRSPQELSGDALAEHKIVQIKVALSKQERIRYDELIAQRNDFLKSQNIFLGTLEGWQRFVQASARSKAGRAAMLAHREARSIAFGTDGKLRVLAELLLRHHHDRVLIFTDDNATVYKISESFLVPAITHQSGVKERHEILTRFRDGRYPTVVTSRVLNEGVDVPEANVAIVLSGTGTTREYVQRLGRILRRGTGEGKLALLYEVIAEDTSEEGVSRRRRGETTQDPRRMPERQQGRIFSDASRIDEGIGFEDL
jgi:superfamily II DNA or RNA helicase